jgi:hypothetical protein
MGVTGREAAFGEVSVAGSGRIGAAWPLLPLAAAWGLWAVGIRSVAIDRMNDLGLVSVLPWPVFASVILLTIGAGLLLQAERPRTITLGLYLVSLVFMLYAIPVFVEQAARVSVTWVHEGFIEYIGRTGTVAPELEARFDWPGFFVLAAFVTRAAGLGSTVDFANWAPVCFNLLYLLALAVLFRSLTRDPRLVWAGLWLFALGNWIGQDYFSPQALAYFLALVILGVVLTWFRVARPRSDAIAARLRTRAGGAGWVARLFGLLTPDDAPPRPASGAQLAGLLVVLVTVFAFIAYSHQLTPFFVTFALLGLLVVNRISARGLPVIFGVMTVAWIAFMTVPFLQGHLAGMLGEIGRLGSIFGTNVAQRIQGSRDHQLVVTVRLAFTVAVWAVAALGAVVRFRDGRRDLSLVVLAVAPLPLIAMQAYGGELVLRLYLFTLPMAAFLVAGLVYGRPGLSPSRIRQGLAVCAATILVLTFFVTRYGNERTDRMTTAEVQAVEKLYSLAPRGSLLAVAYDNLPWKFQGFERYAYASTATGASPGTPQQVAALLRQPGHPAAFLILTRSQGNYLEAFDGLAPGAWDAFVASVRASPLFTQVYRNADAAIFVPAGQKAVGSIP